LAKRFGLYNQNKKHKRRIAVRSLGENGGTITDADPAKTDNRESFPIPHGHRRWRLTSVAHEEGDLNELRAEGRLA
jgi:hypothetical protein